MVILKEIKKEKKVQKVSQIRKDFDELKTNIKGMLFWNLATLIILPLYALMLGGNAILTLISSLIVLFWATFCAIKQIIYLVKILRS